MKIARVCNGTHFRCSSKNATTRNAIDFGHLSRAKLMLSKTIEFSFSSRSFRSPAIFIFSQSEAFSVAFPSTVCRNKHAQTHMHLFGCEFQRFLRRFFSCSFYHCDSCSRARTVFLSASQVFVSFLHFLRRRLVSLFFFAIG